MTEAAKAEEVPAKTYGDCVDAYGVYQTIRFDVNIPGPLSLRVNEQAQKLFPLIQAYRNALANLLKKNGVEVAENGFRIPFAPEDSQKEKDAKHEKLRNFSKEHNELLLMPVTWPAPPKAKLPMALIENCKLPPAFWDHYRNLFED